MKLTLPVLLALLPFALALPSPMPAESDIDLSDLAELPAPSAVPLQVASTSVNLASVATSLAAVQSVTAVDSIPNATPAPTPASKRQLNKRQASGCQAFSSFANNLPLSANSVDGFRSNFPGDAAINSLSGYEYFDAGSKSTGPKNGLLSVNTYSDYSPSNCAAKCDSMSSCQSFSIWRERVPQQMYDATNCPSPADDGASPPQQLAAWQTKCLFYGYLLQPSDSNGDGQWTNDGKFNVVQTSAKVFNKKPFVPATVPDFNAPKGGYGVCAPQGTDPDRDPLNVYGRTVMVDMLASTPGPMNTSPDPSFCRKQCQSIVDAGQPDSDGIKLNCNMFSLFLIRANGNDFWQCQYWTKDLGDADPNNRNTNCGGGIVKASWKYVRTAQVPKFTYTAPGKCTGSDSSTFGRRCIEDFSNMVGRADYVGPTPSNPKSFDLRTTKLAGFTDPNNNQYWTYNDQRNQLDSSDLVNSNYYGNVFMPSNLRTSGMKANGFVFDLESIDIASYELGQRKKGDTIQVNGMRNGQVVATSAPVQVPYASSQTFATVNGLGARNFKKLDALQFVTNYNGPDWTVFKNLVITRFDQNTPRARRDLSSVISIPAELERRDDGPNGEDGLVFSGTVSRDLSVMFVPANSTETDTSASTASSTSSNSSTSTA